MTTPARGGGRSGRRTGLLCILVLVGSCIAVLVPEQAAFAAVTVTIGTAQPIPGGGGALEAISCATTSECVAVGMNGTIDVVTNGVPASASTVTGNPTLYGVSCPDATHPGDCLAVGQNSSNQAVLVAITSGTPGSAQPVTGATLLFAISCYTTTTCLAAGVDSATGAVTVPVTNGAAGTAASTTNPFQYNGLTCWDGSGDCLAVGGQFDAGVPGGAVHLLGPGATASQYVAGTNNLMLLGVACAPTTTTACVAVGQDHTSGGAVVPVTSGVAGSPAYVASGVAAFNGVACVDDHDCLAVGQHFDASFNSAGVVELVTDQAPVSFQVLSTGDAENLFGIACDPSHSSCLAVGGSASGGVVIPISTAPAVAPAFTAKSPPGGAVGTTYHYQFTASGNPAPSFAISSGTLPAGLTLSSSGSLSGTPTKAGTSAFTVAATNSAGVDHAAVSVTVTGPPVTTVTSPAHPFQLGRTVATAYSATDGGTAIASYDVRYRRAKWNGAFGAYVLPSAWQHTTKPSESLKGARGYDYCFSARARNALGQVGAWSPGKCTAIPLDDRALTAATSGWSKITGSHFYAGTATSATKKGSLLELKGVRLDRVALVVETCPGCGSLTILRNASAWKTVSLASATRKFRVVVVEPAFTPRTITVGLRVAGSGKPVVVDGLGAGLG